MKFQLLLLLLCFISYKQPVYAVDVQEPIRLYHPNQIIEYLIYNTAIFAQDITEKHAQNFDLDIDLSAIENAQEITASEDFRSILDAVFIYLFRQLYQDESYPLSYKNNNGAIIEISLEDFKQLPIRYKYGIGILY